jgi:hypothetical protein
MSQRKVPDFILLLFLHHPPHSAESPQEDQAKAWQAKLHQEREAGWVIVCRKSTIFPITSEEEKDKELKQELQRIHSCFNSWDHTSSYRPFSFNSLHQSDRTAVWTGGFIPHLQLCHPVEMNEGKVYMWTLCERPQKWNHCSKALPSLKARWVEVDVSHQQICLAQRPKN